MKLTTLIKHTAELYRIISKSTSPSDKIASQYLRKKKYIGSKERKFISDLLFKMLRIKLLNEFCINEILNSYKEDTHNFQICYKSNKELLTAIITIIILEEKYNKKLSIHSLIPTFSNPESKGTIKLIFENADDLFDNCSLDSDLPVKIQEIIDELSKGSDKDIQKIATLYSIPEWILESLLSSFDINSLKLLSESFIYPAPFCLRVNTSIIDTDEVIGILAKDEITAEKSKISPVGLVINKRVRLNEHKLYKNALVDVQDQGSQIISLALSPEPGKSVLDACAGAGGKTLHLAQLQNDSGKIIANDIEYKRLKELSKRIRKFQYNSVETHLLKHGKELRSSITEFDYILIDAPCSGLGTSRRMPQMKYRLTPELLNKLNKNQSDILNYYSKYLKKGGIMVYATCSILSEENEHITENFLKDNLEFKPDPLKIIFDRANVAVDLNPEDDYKVTLYPHLHGSDGFFIARMRRK